MPAPNNGVDSTGYGDVGAASVIDFEAIVRDPVAPTRFKGEFDSGDHLHPSGRGYAAMGDGIDLRVFP